MYSHFVARGIAGFFVRMYEQQQDMSVCALLLIGSVIGLWLRSLEMQPLSAVTHWLDFHPSWP